MNGVDPCTWLVDVLQRVSVHPAKRAAELTPHLWRKYVTNNPMRSDLGTGQIGQAARARGSPGGIWLRCRKDGSCRSLFLFRLSVLTACTACAPELSGDGIPGSTEKEHVTEWPLTFGHPLRSGEVKKRGDDAISEHCHVKSGFFGALAHA